MLYKKQCRCGCVTTATAPAGVADAPVSYGPNLRAFVAYLLVFQHVPVHRAAMLIARCNWVSWASELTRRYAMRFCRSAAAPANVSETVAQPQVCLLYTSPSPRDRTRSR